MLKLQNLLIYNYCPPLLSLGSIFQQIQTDYNYFLFNIFHRYILLFLYIMFFFCVFILFGREEIERISVIHNYNHAFRGFSAMLTEGEASVLSGSFSSLSLSIYFCLFFSFCLCFYSLLLLFFLFLNFVLTCIFSKMFQFFFWNFIQYNIGV